MDPRLANKGEYNFGERSGTALPNNPGVYYHPQANKFVETAGQRREDGSIAYFENSGKIQADAFAQIGYRAATDEERKAYEAMKKDQEKANRVEASRITTAMSSSK